MATSSDMARHLAPLISASSTTLFSPVNHPSSPVLASAIPLEQHYSFDENLQTRSSFHPQISSSSPAAPDLSWLPMMPDPTATTTMTTTQTPLSPAASVSESLIDPLCSVLQAPASPPTVESPPATPAADDHVLDALYFPESGTFIGYRGFPTFRQTTQLVNAYISTLSSVKKNKSLISRQMYADIKTILRDAGNTQVGSAQFRFWARRNFDLFRDTDGHVCVMHKGKPVAVREDLYDVLAVCHLVCRHGGRDKTLGQLREWHSRVPKNLISQFIKLCPTCNPTSVTADSHPEYVIDAYPQQHQQQQQPPSSLLSVGGSTLDSQTKAHVVSFTLRRSIVCCKMSPGIDAVVKAAEAAAATAGNGRDESCYVWSEDDVRSGVAAAAAAPAAAAVVPMARKASLPKSVKPVAFMAKTRDHLPVVKLEDEETAEYSFPLPRPEHGTFLASGGTESTVSLHSDAGHGDDTEITLAMAEKALANISAYTHPSSPGPLDDVYYDQNSTAAARSPAAPRQHHYRASLAELEPNLVPQQTELPSSPLRPESDDDEYVAGKTPPSSSSPSPAPPRRTCKRRAPALTTTGTTAPAAFLLSSSSSSSTSCASPVRKSARLHKTLLF